MEWVSSFGHPRVKACSAAHRGLSQPYNVLHRLPMPRHSPHTLNSLNLNLWATVTRWVLFIAELKLAFAKINTKQPLFTPRGEKARNTATPIALENVLSATFEVIHIIPAETHLSADDCITPFAFYPIQTVNSSNQLRTRRRKRLLINLSNVECLQKSKQLTLLKPPTWGESGNR